MFVDLLVREEKGEKRNGRKQKQKHERKRRKEMRRNHFRNTFEKGVAFQKDGQKLQLTKEEVAFGTNELVDSHWEEVAQFFSSGNEAGVVNVEVMEDTHQLGHFALREILFRGDHAARGEPHVCIDCS